MASRRNDALPKIRSYRYVVSACLAGINCAYDGTSRPDRSIRNMVDDGEAISVCPELLGGSTVPREPCEICGGSGRDVLAKKARVLSRAGGDVSRILVEGARRTLRLARRYNIRKAILKSNSPSCGKGRIYDGTFTGTLRRGDGVTAALLKLNGITVFTERGPDAK